MILDAKRVDAETARFLWGLRKRFEKLAAKGEVPGYYARPPFDLIVIDTKYLRDLGLLKPEIVIFATLHELYHALHPRSLSHKDAWDWSGEMLRLLTTRGYTSRMFKKDSIATRKKQPVHQPYSCPQSGRQTRNKLQTRK